MKPAKVENQLKISSITTQDVSFSKKKPPKQTVNYKIFGNLRASRGGKLRCQINKINPLKHFWLTYTLKHKHTHTYTSAAELSSVNAAQSTSALIASQPAAAARTTQTTTTAAWVLGASEIANNWLDFCQTRQRFVCFPHTRGCTRVSSDTIERIH